MADLGPEAVATILFLFVVAWCFVHRRVDQSLAVLALYLGLLDGYLKLRTGSSLFTLAPDALLAAIAGGAFIRAVRSHQPLPLPPLAGLVLAFSLVVIVEMFNSQGRDLAGSVAGLLQDLEFMPLFFLGFVFMRRKTQIEKLLLILVVCASLGGFVSLYQSRLTPDQFASWGPGYSQRILGTGPYTGAPRIGYVNGAEVVRPFGLGSDIGAGALIAALALPSLIALMITSRGKVRLATAPLAVGIALAAATSGTRTALVVFVVCAGMFALLAARSRHALRVIAALLVAGLLVYGAFAALGSQTSTAVRAESITPSHFLSTFSQHSGSSLLLLGTYLTKYPLGVGVGSVGPAATAFSGLTAATDVLNAETEWNFLILETGIAGLAIFLIINVRLAWVSLVRIRRIPDQQLRLQLAALAAPLFGLLAAGFTAPTTATVPQAPYFWFIAGVLSYWLIAAYRNHGPGTLPARETKTAASPVFHERQRLPVSATP